MSIEEMRARYPGMILLFRRDGSYSTEGDDREAVRRVIGVDSFEHRDLEGHLRKLLRAKCRVAICDEVK